MDKQGVGYLGSNRMHDSYIHVVYGYMVLCRCAVRTYRPTDHEETGQDHRYPVTHCIQKKTISPRKSIDKTMKKTFDKAYYLSHRACYEKEKMEKLVDSNPHSTIQEFLNWDISIKDKFYFVRRYTELTTKQLQLLAILCAKVSLDIYENKYPDDKRVRECIEATEQFIDGKITIDELSEKRRVAYAADDDAADDAAAAAAAAAYAAAYAAEKSTYHQDKLLNALQQFCTEQE